MAGPWAPCSSVLQRCRRQELSGPRSPCRARVLSRGVGRDLKGPQFGGPMMPHTRQEKPFSEKLKAFFRVGKTHGFPRHQEAELVGTCYTFQCTLSF